MSNKTISSDSNQAPSFDEFKSTILKQGANADFLNRLANLHSSVPRSIRILYNFDPTGTLSAMQQLFSEATSDREQDNIIRAIYDLAIRVWKVEGSSSPNLSDEKFKFLFFVYARSDTDIYSRVEADEVQNKLGLSQQKTISVGEYLDKNGLIIFNSWVVGIRITHKGILRVEADLLGNDKLPEYVNEDEIKKIEDRIRLRFALLKHLHKEAEGDTFKMILHTDLANELKLDHRRVVSQLLPYMGGEGWIEWRTNDSVTITEEGIDRAIALLT